MWKSGGVLVLVSKMWKTWDGSCNVCWYRLLLFTNLDVFHCNFSLLFIQSIIQLTRLYQHRPRTIAATNRSRRHRHGCQMYSKQIWELLLLNFQYQHMQVSSWGCIEMNAAVVGQSCSNLYIYIHICIHMYAQLYAISKTRLSSATLEWKTQDARSKWWHTNGNTTRTQSWKVCSPAPEIQLSNWLF